MYHNFFTQLPSTSISIDETFDEKYSIFRKALFIPSISNPPILSYGGFLSEFFGTWLILEFYVLKSVSDLLI